MFTKVKTFLTSPNAAAVRNVCTRFPCQPLGYRLKVVRVAFLEPSDIHRQALEH